MWLELVNSHSSSMPVRDHNHSPTPRFGGRSYPGEGLNHRQQALYTS